MRYRPPSLRSGQAAGSRTRRWKRPCAPTWSQRGSAADSVPRPPRHKNPATTRIYTDVAPELLAEVLEREGEFPE